jgi:hypothetical protein
MSVRDFRQAGSKPPFSAKGDRHPLDKKFAAVR